MTARSRARTRELERRVAELEARLDEDTRLLIHALADAVKMLRSRDEADEAATAEQS